LLKIKIFTTTVLPVVSNGCGTWSDEEHVVCLWTKCWRRVEKIMWWGSFSPYRS